MILQSAARHPPALVCLSVSAIVSVCLSVSLSVSIYLCLSIVHCVCLCEGVLRAHTYKAHALADAMHTLFMLARILSHTRICIRMTSQVRPAQLQQLRIVEREGALEGGRGGVVPSCDDISFAI